MDQTSVYKTMYLKDIKTYGQKEEEWWQKWQQVKGMKKMIAELAWWYGV